MIETNDLILDKAKFSDWETMYHNVWSRPESARYMRWNVTTNENDARIRMQKTMDFQKDHDVYTVYGKATGAAIGFAGVEELSPRVCGETGICLGPDYVGRGLGKQILRALISHCMETYDAAEFIYSTREENTASIRLAEAMGFTYISSESKVDNRDGHSYNLLKYNLKLCEL